jgi:hypothetical protein
MFPKPKNDNETLDMYMSRCRLYLSIFKTVLQNKIQINKLICRKIDLFNEPNIHWIINEPDYNIKLIADTFVNKLQCYYDRQDNICYFSVPANVLCPFTITPLTKVIRILEYGGYNMSPLNWIRLSYRTFIESTIKNI